VIRPIRRTAFQQARFLAILLPLLAAFSDRPIHAQDSQVCFPPSKTSDQPGAGPVCFPLPKNSDRAATPAPAQARQSIASEFPHSTAIPALCPELNDDPEPISQIWYTDAFGPALFENFKRQSDGVFSFTGKWQERHHEEAGIIEEGTFDTQRSEVTFRYFQPWNGEHGKAVFKLGTYNNLPALTGYYIHDDSFSRWPWGNSWQDPGLLLVATFDPQKACPSTLGMIFLNSYNPDLPGTNRPTKVPKPRISGKEGAKDVPSWVKVFRPFVGEKSDEFATRVMNRWYGEGEWEERLQAMTEFSQIKKWADRAFIDP
jgi:hypothetical protein